MRRSVSRAEIAALKKRAPAVELNPIAVIVRTIVDSSSADVPRTAMQEALIGAAHAAFAISRKVQRLILDSSDPNGGRLVEGG